jgi:hypothetical protein
MLFLIVVNSTIWEIGSDEIVYVLIVAELELLGVSLMNQSTCCTFLEGFYVFLFSKDYFQSITNSVNDLDINVADPEAWIFQ